MKESINIIGTYAKKYCPMMALLAFAAGLSTATILLDEKYEKQVKEEIVLPKLKSKNPLEIDLDSMKQSGTQLRILRDKDGNEIARRFIVWRNTVGKTSVHITIKEPIDDLKYNKNEYLEYIEQEAKAQLREEIIPDSNFKKEEVDIKDN